MIITKEQQEREVLKYAIDNNMDKVEGFVAGMKATIELVGRILEAANDVKG